MCSGTHCFLQLALPAYRDKPMVIPTDPPEVNSTMPYCTTPRWQRKRTPDTMAFIRKLTAWTLFWCLAPRWWWLTWTEGEDAVEAYEGKWGPRLEAIHKGPW